MSQPRDEAGSASLASSTQSLSMRILNKAYFCSLTTNKENHTQALCWRGANTYTLLNRMSADGKKKNAPDQGGAHHDPDVAEPCGIPLQHQRVSRKTLII